MCYASKYHLSSGCYSKAPQTGWLISNRSLLLTALEAGGWRSGLSTMPVPGRARFLVADFFFCVLTWQKGTIPIDQSSGFIISFLPSKPTIKTITLGLMFQQMNFGRHKHSVHCKCTMPSIMVSHSFLYQELRYWSRKKVHKILIRKVGYLGI